MIQFRVVGLLVVVAVAVAGWGLTCGARRLEQEVARVGPLDRQHYARLTVITVGTGGRYENPVRRGPATALGLGDQVVLVDAGRALADALRLAGIPVSQPDVVYLTNLLPENTLGLDDLLLMGWINGRENPLRLVGPAGTRAFAEALMKAHHRGVVARAGGLGIRRATPSFEVTEISDGWSENHGGLSVRAGALAGGPIETLAYRFEAMGRSAVVSGSGWAPDALVAFARGANLLIHEAVFVPTGKLAEEVGIDEDPALLEREAAQHTSIESVGMIAKRAGVETLVLVRLRPPPIFDLQITSLVDDDFDGRVVIAADGDEITP